MWQRIFQANLLALWPLGAGILGLWLPYQIYHALGAPLVMFADPPWLTAALITAGFITIIGSILLHELLHGLVLKLAGFRPRFSIQYGVPYADIPPDCTLTRRQYLVMALTPLVVMSSTGALTLLILPPSLGQLLLIALLLNSAASIGDLYVAHRVWLAAPDALFASGQGIFVYIPLSRDPRE